MSGSGTVNWRPGNIAKKIFPNYRYLPIPNCHFVRALGPVVIFGKQPIAKRNLEYSFYRRHSRTPFLMANAQNAQYIKYIKKSAIGPKYARFLRDG